MAIEDDDLDFRLVKEHSALDQDLSEWKSLYLRMKDDEKKALIDMLNLVGVWSNGMKYPTLHQLRFRIHFVTGSVWNKEDYKKPYLPPETLLKAIRKWDQGKDFIPDTGEDFDDLTERD